MTVELTEQRDSVWQFPLSDELKALGGVLDWFGNYPNWSFPDFALTRKARKRIDNLVRAGVLRKVNRPSPERRRIS